MIKSHIICGDYIELMLDMPFKDKITHAILNPPYKKINSNSKHRKILRSLGIETVNLYTAFVALTVLAMAEKGQVVAIIPRSFCNGPYYRSFREFLLKHTAIRHIHLFKSRSKAFKDDNVLQENIIIHLEKNGKQGEITISNSTDQDFLDINYYKYPFEKIVYPEDKELFIHIPTSPKKLASEIEAGRKEIKTDSVSMTIGEIINLYKDGDLELSPAYQRLFRWNNPQKSRFIESIILGIPLPSIFVAQQSDGKWSVVDGLQRLSSILQFVGELDSINSDNDNDDDNDIIDSSTPKEVASKYFTISETRKLEALNGLSWTTIPSDIQRLIKRSRLSLNIILLTDDNIQSQYEVFQRLNTGGLHLEAQEIRNCLIIMLDKNFYDILEELKNYSNFLSTIKLTKNKIIKKYHMELILRFLIAKCNNIIWSNYNLSTISIDDFIDSETTCLIKNIKESKLDLNKEITIFKETFDLLSKTLGDDSFKKYIPEKNNFEGQFLLSSYEAITTGVSLNINKLKELSENDFKEKIKLLYSNQEFIQYSARGVKVPFRFKKMIEFSKEYFGNEN